ncbi:tRNA-guanine transglycosylase, partial [bacterium]|nr:tRNA-guanine transglycosylase [bacterium]
KKVKKKNKQLLFCIVQGSLYKDLRIKCAQDLSKIGFDGYAIGGLAVGETVKDMLSVLDYTIPELPEDKPHYLMGVGYPKQIIEAVKRGVDMFDCVIPTREARHGRLYFGNLKNNSTININNAKFKNALSAINSKSNILELREYTKGYLRHLFSVKEPLALRLATLNNIEFYLNLMKEIRLAIKNNKL